MNNYINIYKCIVKEIDGVIRFFVAFNDIHCISHEIEVSEDIYLEFQMFLKEEKRQQNHFDRHIEHIELTDEALYDRSTNEPELTEDIVISKVYISALNTALLTLTNVQRRRFILHYEYGFSLMKIAKLENCSDASVMESIKQAKEKLAKSLEKYFEEI